MPLTLLDDLQALQKAIGYAQANRDGNFALSSTPYFGCNNLNQFAQYLKAKLELHNKKIKDLDPHNFTTNDYIKKLNEKIKELQNQQSSLGNDEQFFQQVLNKWHSIRAEKQQEGEKISGSTKEVQYQPTAKDNYYEENDISFTEIQGYRSTQEDTAILAISEQTITEEILNNINTETIKATNNLAGNSGSTHLSAAINKDGKILIKNAGDSRAVAYIRNPDNGEINVRRLTVDHKPDDEFEEYRIVQQGGHVCYGRVNSRLAVSRSLGDNDYTGDNNNELISKEHDSYYIDLQKEYPNCQVLLVLSCDGLYEKNQEKNPCFINAVKNHWEAIDRGETPPPISRELTKVALSCGSTDNISVAALSLDCRKDKLLEKNTYIAINDGHGRETVSKKAKEVGEKLLKDKKFTILKTNKLGSTVAPKKNRETVTNNKNDQPKRSGVVSWITSLFGNSSSADELSSDERADYRATLFNISQPENDGYQFRKMVTKNRDSKNSNNQHNL